MRLHSLSVRAFGPFADIETVDFDELSDAGLFLLRGPTGGGKTSILDAVVFALYGVVPGDRAQGLATRLRSDHAAADVATEVVLDVTISGRRLRVTRRPGWDRPKRRGTGMTRQQPSVVLQAVEANGSMTVLSTRLDEAGEFLRDALGMGPDQFCQVVLLPQGRFAEFLRADADSRRAILQSLFATDRFAAVEALLVEQRRAAARAVDAGDESLRRLLARVCEVVGDRDDPPQRASPAESLSWVEDLAALALWEADDGVRLAGSAAAHLEALQEDHAATLRAASRHDIAVDLFRRAGALNASDGLRDAARTELDAARRAATAAGELHAVRSATSRRDEARTLRERATHALPVSCRSIAPPLLADHLQRLTDELAVLAKTSNLVAAHTAAEARVAELTRRVERSERALATFSSAMGVIPERLADARRAAGLASEAQALCAGARSDRDAAAHRSSEARRRDALRTEIAHDDDALHAARTSAVELHEHWLELRERRLAAYAAELASSLADDSPCPVCGSAEHPQPANGDISVDEAAERAAGRAYRTAEARVAALGEAREHTLSALASATAAAGEARVDDLVDMVRRHADNADQLGRRAAGLVAAQQLVQRLEAEHAAAETTTRTLLAEVAQLSAQRQEATAQAAAMWADLQRAQGGDATIDVRIRRLESEAVSVSDAVATWRRYDDSAAEVVEAVQRATAACRAADFVDVSDAQRALRSVEKTRDLERILRQLRDEEVALAEQLSAAGLDGHALVTTVAQARPDVAASAAELAEARARAATAASTGALRQQRSDALHTLVAEVHAAVERLAPLLHDFEEVAALASLVDGSGGDNALRMRLSSYVLAARMEQVAEAASERLMRMTDGRFTLQHSDVAAMRRGRAGLGLLVHDSWTGQARDPATLSGGEAFTASLALALGLADVVCAEAGGMVMETLFIDEGFGSLDEDTLEDVMDVLDALREGGRSVGIVSHVAELAARIPTQLLVEKSPAGSSIRRPADRTIPASGGAGVTRSAA